MNFIAKMEKKIGKYAIKHLTIILIACYVAGYAIEYWAPNFAEYLTLNPYAILHGQVWRIVSFVLIPPPESNIIFALIMLFFYFSIGTTLEKTWGDFRYNLYLFSGMLFTVIGSFVIYGIAYLIRYLPADSTYTINGVSYWVKDAGFLFYSKTAAPYTVGGYEYFQTISQFFSTYYVNMSIFLAYAATFPDNKVLLMFFIPVKVKILGFIYGGFIVYEMVSQMISLNYYGLIFVPPVVIGASLLNFLVFFLTTRGLFKTRTKTQRNFVHDYKKEAKEVRRNAGVARHRCTICGRTEKDGAELSFRFCSKCEGSHEYCQEHLYTHIHLVNNKFE